MRVVHFTLGAPGCIHYRNVNPSEYLNRNGHEGYVVETDLSEEDALKKSAQIVRSIADVVVVTRFNNWAGIINLARKYGKHVVYELDDSPDLHASHNAKEIALMNKWIERTADMGKVADAVTVTTEPLAEYMRQYNDHVYVVPNMVDYAMDQWNLPKKDDGRIVIGYFGGSSHLPDIRLVSKTLMRIAKEFPAVHIHYGAVPTKVVTADAVTMETRITETEKNAHAKALRSEFSHLKKKRKKQLYPLDIEEYGSVYADFDIAIGPLVSHDFNKYKSNLKFLEAAGYGLPMVASREYPFIESIEKSGGGFLADTQEEFYQALKKLVKSKALRLEMGAKARKYAFDNFDLDTNGKIYLDTYNEIISRKPNKRTATPIMSGMTKAN